MINMKSFFCILACAIFPLSAVAQEVPAVKGKPIIDGPKLLSFP